jgi:hypothetical protein
VFEVIKLLEEMDGDLLVAFIEPVKQLQVVLFLDCEEVCVLACNYCCCPWLVVL